MLQSFSSVNTFKNFHFRGWFYGWHGTSITDGISACSWCASTWLHTVRTATLILRNFDSFSFRSLVLPLLFFLSPLPLTAFTRTTLVLGNELIGSNRETSLTFWHHSDFYWHLSANSLPHLKLSWLWNSWMHFPAFCRQVALSREVIVPKSDCWSWSDFPRQSNVSQLKMEKYPRDCPILSVHFKQHNNHATEIRF